MTLWVCLVAIYWMAQHQSHTHSDIPHMHPAQTKNIDIDLDGRDWASDSAKWLVPYGRPIDSTNGGPFCDVISGARTGPGRVRGS